MFEIIIFFVVISVISNIIKAVGRPKPPQPERAGSGVPVAPNEIQLPENNAERIPQKYRIKVENHIPKVTTSPQVRQQDIPRQRIQPQTVPQTKPQPKVGLSNLTPDRLVEGIILSEILAPPKSRRQGVR